MEKRESNSTECRPSDNCSPHNGDSNQRPRSESAPPQAAAGTKLRHATDGTGEHLSAQSLRLPLQPPDGRNGISPRHRPGQRLPAHRQARTEHPLPRSPRRRHCLLGQRREPLHLFYANRRIPPLPPLHERTARLGRHRPPHPARPSRLRFAAMGVRFPHLDAGTCRAMDGNDGHPCQQRRPHTGECRTGTVEIDFLQVADARTAGTLLPRQPETDLRRKGRTTPFGDGTHQSGRIRQVFRQEDAAPEESPADVEPPRVQGLPAQLPPIAPHRLLHRHFQPV